jgi:hypothetical protein
MNMKFRSLMWIVLIFSLAILMSCGGGGGGGVGGNSGIGNTMTVIVKTESGTGETASITPYTEGSINGYGYYDPDMEADIYPDTGRMIIMLSSGVTGGTPPDTTINIVTSGHTAGAYPIDGTSAMNGIYTYITYKDGSEYHDGVISSGTVTIDSIGNVGDPVIGSFSGVVLCSAPSHTHGFSGTFNMKRAH